MQVHKPLEIQAEVWPDMQAGVPELAVRLWFSAGSDCMHRAAHSQHSVL